MIAPKESRAHELIHAVYPQAGVVTKEFQQLGIMVKTDQLLVEDVSEVVRPSAAKVVLVFIPRVTNAMRMYSVRDRAKFVRSDLMPTLVWGEPWIKTPPKVMSKWENAIERAIVGKNLRFRSKAVAWQGIGIDSNPRHQAMMRVLRFEQRRLFREVYCPGHLYPRRCTKRWEQVQTMWAWKPAGTACFETREGVLDLARDSKKTIARVAEAASLRVLWSHDNRSNDEESLAVVATGMPYVLPAIRVLRAPALTDDSCVIKSIVRGVAWDYRRFQTTNKQRAKAHKAQVNLSCVCGEPLPDRRHLQWRCPRLGVCPPTRDCWVPVASIEEGLLIPVIEDPPKPGARIIQVPQSMLAFLASDEPAMVDARIMMASDGGSSFPEIVATLKPMWQMRRGAWSVAVMDQQGRCRRWSGPTLGIDQTAYASEVWAWMIAATACRMVGRAAHFLIDNLATVRMVQAVLQDTAVPKMDGAGLISDSRRQLVLYDTALIGFRRTANALNFGALHHGIRQYNGANSMSTRTKVQQKHCKRLLAPWRGL